MLFQDVPCRPVVAGRGWLLAVWLGAAVWPSSVAWPADALSPLYRSRLIPAQGDDVFTVLDRSRGDLRRFTFDGNRVSPAPESGSSAEAPPAPSAELDRSEGDRGNVAIYPWARHCEIIDPGADAAATGTEDSSAPRRVQLPLTPHILCRLGETNAVAIADAFDGRLVILDVARAEIVAEGSVDGHNIGGLCWLPAMSALAVSHQALQPGGTSLGGTSLEGTRLVNRLTLIPYRSAPPGFQANASQVIELDVAVGGAGDPGALMLDRQGSLLIALRGVGRVIRLDLESGTITVSPFEMVHPIDFALTREGDELWVLDDFGNQLVSLDARTLERREVWPIPRDAPAWPADRGRRAFFDARLSADRRASCHSCHSLGHTPGLLADTKADGSYGTPKLIPTLLGTGLSDPWGWTGSMKDLHTQVRRSVTETLGGAEPDGRLVNDLVAFMHRLDPPPPLVASASGRAARGSVLFRELGCAACHAGFTYTSHGTFDVGLRDEAGNEHFNPPSLRGVGRRQRLLHDGRASDLADLIEGHGHGVSRELDPTELADLIGYLKSL